MASAFLSYAREDAKTAKRVADYLQGRGHSVWWDQQIRGGSRFSGAIEEALKQAEAVVVLWSKHSVASAWVCDEAAEGRDTDRLVTVLIDDVRPPIGFRQFHCLDLSGKQTAEQLKELDVAVAAKGSAPESADSEALPKPPRSILRRRWSLAAAALLILLIAGAGLFWARNPANASEPTIAVIPFTDLSPGHDKAYLANGMSEAILTMLAREPGISVIGRTSAEQFRGQAEDLARMRKVLGVTHVLEGSAQPVGSQLRMSVRLVDAASGKEVWAEEYRRELTNIFALQDDIGQQVAQKLKGTFAAHLPDRRDRTDVSIYDLYLAGRAKMRDRSPASLKAALDLAKQVTAADPNYGPGHALYADAVIMLSDNSYGQVPAQTALRVAVKHAQRAIALAPNSAEGYASLGAAWAQIDGARAIAPLRKALALDPSHAELRFWLGAAQNDIGHNQEALENLRSAVDLDPLSRPAVWRLVVVYAASRDFDAAENVIRQYEGRGGSPAWAEFNRGVVERYRGNIALAARHFESALRSYPDSRQVRLALAGAYHDIGLFDRTRALTGGEKPLVQAYLANSPQARELARSAPASVWFGDDLDTAVEVLAVQQDWAGLAQLYDTPGALRARACRIPIAAGRLAVALQAVGRSGESRQLTQCASRSLQAQQQGPYRNEFLPEGTLHAAKAQLLAIGGNQDAAFRELAQATETGFRIPAGVGLQYLPGFARLRSAPQYAALERRLAALAAGERAKLKA